MTIRAFLAALATVGLVSSANAAMPVAPLNGGVAVVKVAEGCGAGFWRGPGGKCHPMYDGKACPAGYHLGPDRHRCWPN